ncbi:MAG: hypothetical protein J5910_00840 [Lachnospiraceae bacterium]|nr:hypothetical protein [Lachnospiraceae bacterium]
MTLSEAIAECERNARRYESRSEEILKHGGGAAGISIEQAKMNLQYAKDQRQIKEWLRELQKYRWMNHMDSE